MRNAEEENQKLKNERQLLMIGDTGTAPLTNQEIFKYQSRIGELEQYCEELLSKLTRWSKLDS